MPFKRIVPSPNIFFHETASIDFGAKIGNNVKIWHNTHITSTAQIGDNCTIGQNCYVAGIVGNGCKIQNNVNIFKGVFLEDDVFVGPNVVFTNILTPRAFINRKSEFRATLIKKGASIGAGAIIVCGNIIGMYALVGAGAVVTKDVSEYTLVYGNPAREWGVVNKDGEIIERKPDFRWWERQFLFGAKNMGDYVSAFGFRRSIMIRKSSAMGPTWPLSASKLYRQSVETISTFDADSLEKAIKDLSDIERLNL